jgi:hypothetical protein
VVREVQGWDNQVKAEVNQVRVQILQELLLAEKDNLLS